MRRFKVLGLGVLAMLALAATTASAASAKTVLTEAGAPAKQGATATVGVLIGGCSQYTAGELEGKPGGVADGKASFTGATTPPECEEGHALSGSITSGKVSIKEGKAEESYKSTLEVTQNGSSPGSKCVYKITKIDAQEDVGPVTVGFGVVTGKLNKEKSSKRVNKKTESEPCGKTLTTSATAFILDGESEPFGVES